MKYLLLAFVAISLSSYTVSTGWVKAGTKAADYDMGTDASVGRLTSSSSTIKSTKPIIDGNGMLMQSISPTPYLGKRLKLTAYMKAAAVKDWAGMWMRVEGDAGKQLLFDNMKNRPITGTKDWTKCEIVLDVPIEAKNIAYGGLLVSTGQVWFDAVVLEEVPFTVAPTDYTNR